MSVIHENLNINQSLTWESYSQRLEGMEEQKITILKILDKIGEPCKKILQLDSLGYSRDDIAKQVGLATQTVKNKVGKCREKFQSLVKANPSLFEKLMG